MTNIAHFTVRLMARLVLLLSLTAAAAAQDIDYSRAIHLDAESLAEQGIAEGYASILPVLRTYVAAPLPISEKGKSDNATYTVLAGGRSYPIFPSPLGGDEYESWGVATVALFEIVNRQLAHAPVKFFAIDSGNGLMGVFLTEQQAIAARKALPRRTDWPYIPKMQAPWFGQYH